MKRPRDLVLGSVLLALGLVPLLALENSPTRRAPSAEPAAGPTPSGTTPVDETAGCPRGQMDDFGVCVPVAQPRQRSHSDAD